MGIDPTVSQPGEGRASEAAAALPQSKHFSTPTHDEHYLKTFLLGLSISHYDCQYLWMWAETQVEVARVGMFTLSSLDSIDMFR